MGTADLTEHLFEQLAAEKNSSATLLTAIDRFTDWQKNLMKWKKSSGKSKV